MIYVSFACQIDSLYKIRIQLYKIYMLLCIHYTLHILIVVDTDFHIYGG